jgi:hypothetical protein
MNSVVLYMKFKAFGRDLFCSGKWKKGSDYVGSFAVTCGRKTDYVGSFAVACGRKTDYVGDLVKSC